MQRFIDLRRIFAFLVTITGTLITDRTFSVEAFHEKLSYDDYMLLSRPAPKDINTQNLTIPKPSTQTLIFRQHFYYYADF